MTLVPRNQQFFYLVMVSALVVLAVMIAFFANKSPYSNLSTSKAYQESTHEMMYEDGSMEMMQDTQMDMQHNPEEYNY